VTERDAQTIIRMVEGTWNMNLGSAGREVWAGYLVKQDAEIATQAVAKLAERQRERPTVADVRGMILLVKNSTAAVKPSLASEKQTKLPEWVGVWWWLRNIRDPHELRPLPHQSEPPAPEAMSISEYEQYLREWITAGKPTKGMESLSA
jgi:hypothetical protein